MATQFNPETLTQIGRYAAILKLDLERYAINPTLTLAPGPRTRVTLGYEHLHDTRVADRGITSFQGRPADVDVSTFYGDPNQSYVRASVDLWSANVEHQAGKVTLRNRTLVGDYDRSYQNFVPGAVTADATNAPQMIARWTTVSVPSPG